MYDELIERLRNCLTEVNCTGCDCNNSLIKQAADAIEDLENRLNLWRQDKIRRWIPVTERLPEKNQEVLIFLFGEDPYIAWHNGEYWCTEDFRLDEPDDWQPTHWFPLPQPPKDGEP